MTNNTIITIARQYGSGGRAIGEKLASLLNIKYYDKEIITLSAQKCGMSTEAVNQVDEKASNSLLYTLAMGSSVYHNSVGISYDVPINDKLFVVQSDIIRNLAAESSCIIVGRCADYVLREYPNCIKLFIYADFDDRVKNVMQRQNLNAAQAKDLVVKTDKRRNNYYNYYTGQKWGKIENYDLSINTSKISGDGAAELLAKYIEIYNHK